MYQHIASNIVEGNPIYGMIIGATSGTISYLAFLEQGTTILGFFGALFGAFVSFGYFVKMIREWWKSYIDKKNLKRRKTDTTSS